MRVRLLSLRCRAVKCVSDQSDVLKLRTLPKKENQAPQSALLPLSITNKPCGTWEYPATSMKHAEDICMHLIHKQLLNNSLTLLVKRAETEIEVWDINVLLRPHIQPQFVVHMKAWRQSGKLINSSSQCRKAVLTAGSSTWEWLMQLSGCEALKFKNTTKLKFKPKPTHPRSLIQPSETSSHWLPLLLTWWCKFGEDREDHIFPLASLLVWKTMTTVTACHLATFCHFQHFHTLQDSLVFMYNKYYIDASPTVQGMELSRCSDQCRIWTL